jgi:hypothetical protein
MLSLLPTVHNPEYQDLRRRIADLTDF